MLLAHSARAAKFAVALTAALAMTACAKNPADEAGVAGGVGAPPDAPPPRPEAIRISWSMSVTASSSRPIRRI